MGRNKSDYKIHDTGTFNALNPDRYGAAKQGNDPWKRKRKERPEESAYNLPKVDVHGVLFAVVAVVFVVYPLIQWALGR